MAPTICSGFSSANAVRNRWPADARCMLSFTLTSSAANCAITYGSPSLTALSSSPRAATSFGQVGRCSPRRPVRLTPYPRALLRWRHEPLRQEPHSYLQAPTSYGSVPVCPGQPPCPPLDMLQRPLALAHCPCSEENYRPSWLRASVSIFCGPPGVERSRDPSSKPKPRSSELGPKKWCEHSRPPQLGEALFPRLRSSPWALVSAQRCRERDLQDQRWPFACRATPLPTAAPPHPSPKRRGLPRLPAYFPACSCKRDIPPPRPSPALGWWPKLVALRQSDSRTRAPFPAPLPSRTAPHRHRNKKRCSSRGASPLPPRSVPSADPAAPHTSPDAGLNNKDRERSPRCHSPAASIAHHPPTAPDTPCGASHGSCRRTADTPSQSCSRNADSSPAPSSDGL